MEDTMTIDEVQEPQQQQPDPPLKKLYKVVKDKGLYSKSYDEFITKYSNADEINKLHQVVTGQGLYTKNRQDFDAQYFPELEKKNQIQTTPPLPSGSKDVSGGVSGGTISTTEPENKEPIPTVFKVGDELVPATDAIGLSLASSKIKDAVKGSGIRGETGRETLVPDEDKRKDAEETRKEIAKLGYDPDELTDEFSDFPQDAFNNPTTSKEILLDLRGKNKIKYHQLLNEAKNRYAIRENAAKLANENIPQDENGRDDRITQTAVIAGNEYVGDNIEVNDAVGLNAVIQKKKELINQFLPDGEKEKAQQRLKETYSIEINKNLPLLDEAYQQSTLKNKLDINQFAGLSTYEAFEPEKYEQAIRILGQPIVPQYNIEVNVTPEEKVKSITTDSALAAKLGGKLSEFTKKEQIATEVVLRDLSAQGEGNLKNHLNRKILDLEQQYKAAATYEEKGQLQLAYLEAMSEVEGLDNSEKDKDIKYPLTAELKFDKWTKEALDDRGTSIFELGYNAFGHHFSSGVDAFENVLVTNFGSESDKTKLSMNRLGGMQLNEKNNYILEDEQRIGLPVITQISDSLKKDIKAITGGKKYSDWTPEEKKKSYDLLSNRRDEVEAVTNPESGETKNFFSTATLISSTQAIGSVAAFVMEMGGLKVLGMGAKIAEANALFKPAYAEAFNQRIAEGKSESDANEYGILHGGIMGIMAFTGSKYEAVLNTLKGSKSPITKYIAGMGEDAWNSLYKKNRTFIEKLAASTKHVAKEQVGMISRFAIAPTILGDLANNAFYNQDTQLQETLDKAWTASSEMAISFSPLMAVGVGRGSLKRDASPLEKSAIWQHGYKPELGKLEIDEAVKRGELTTEVGNERKAIIDNVASLIKKVPTENDRGKLLTDKQRQSYLYRLVLENKSKELAKDLPEKQAEKEEYKAMVAKAENGIELEAPTDIQLQAKAKKLEAELTPEKDTDGKNKPVKDEAKLKAELEAVNNEIKTRESFVDTKLSEPLEGRDEQGIPIGDNVPAPVEVNKEGGEVVDFDAMRKDLKTNPESVPNYPIGTIAKNSLGEKLELKEVPINKLTLEEASKQDANKVESYSKLTTEAPPIYVIEKKNGEFYVGDGHNRIKAAEFKGDTKIKAWVLSEPNRSKQKEGGVAIPVSEVGEITNKKAFNFLKQRQFGDEFANKALAEFTDKDGNRYYIQKKANQDLFSVYDAKDLDSQIESGKAVLPKSVAMATFDTSKLLGEDGFFTGFKEGESIQVQPEYRRKGIATALTKFAEQTYKRPYKPTNLLSESMQGFVDSYQKSKPESLLDNQPKPQDKGNTVLGEQKQLINEETKAAKISDTKEEGSTPNESPTENIGAAKEGTGGKEPPKEPPVDTKELDKMTSNIPNGGEVKKYLSGDTIKKYQKDKDGNDVELTNPQEIIAQELEPALKHGIETIDKAKEIFGDAYVEKTLDYIETQNLNPENKALLYVTLENDMAKRTLAEPNNVGLKKQQDLVRAKSQAYLRSNSLAINMGRLRKFAETGYDISKVTDRFFSSKQLEDKAVIEKNVQADADTIQKEAEAVEMKKETINEITPDLEQKIKEGIDAEITKIYEQLPKEKKTAVDKAIKALDNIHAKLRSKTYESTLGIPIAIIDMGVVTIRAALKAGVKASKAIELGIEKIKEKWGKEWDREDAFRKDYLNGLKSQGVLDAEYKKQTAKEYRILETERNRQLEKVGNLKDKLNNLKQGIKPEPKSKEVKLDTPEIEALKKEVAAEEKKLNALDATDSRVKNLETELQRLQDRKSKDAKVTVPKDITDREIELKEKIAEEKKVIAKEVKENAEPKTRQELLADAKDALQKRIDEVREQIITKRADAVKDKKPLNKDAEYQQMEAEYKALTGLKDKYLPKEGDKFVDEKKLKVAEKRIINEIENINKQIELEQKNEKNKPDAVVSDNITKLKAEKEARLAVLEAVDPTPKEFVQETLIEKGFGKEVNIKTKTGVEKRTILDWKKLAGEEGSVDKIKANVEQALQDKGYTPEQIVRIQNKFTQEYNDLRASVIEKGLNVIAERNKVSVTPDQKSAAKKLAEMYNYGLFDKNLADYEVALSRTLGVDKLSKDNIAATITLGKALSTLYSTDFQGKRLNESQIKSAINVIEEQMRYVLNQEVKKHGSGFLTVADYTRTYMDITQRMALVTMKQALENPFSGQLESMYAGIGEGTKGLNARARKIGTDIYKEMVLEKGYQFGDVSSTFVNKGGLEMGLHNLSDNKLLQGVVSTMIGKSTLDAVDSAYKSKITQQKFTYNLIKILTKDRLIDGKIEKGMPKEEAIKYVAEKLTGQSFKDAQETARDIIKKVNDGAKQKIFNDSPLFVDRLANDIVNAALVNGEKISEEMVTASYNSAYKAAGRGLGHVANNFISDQVGTVTGKIETKINNAIKEKEYNKAAILTLESIFFRNIANPFVGGGTNWVVLKAEKSGLGLLSGLGSMIRRGDKMDLTTEIGIKRLEQSMYESLKIKDKFIRGAVGGLTTVISAMALAGIVSTDDFKKWRDKNQWAKKYTDILTPEVWLGFFAKEDKKVDRYLAGTVNKNDAFDKSKMALKAGASVITGSDKAGAETGKVLGSTVGVPIPWRLIRDVDQIWVGASGGEPYKIDNTKPQTFMEGYFKGGVIDYLGYAPKPAESNTFSTETVSYLKEKGIELPQITISKKPFTIYNSSKYTKRDATVSEVESYNKLRFEILDAKIKAIHKSETIAVNLYGDVTAGMENVAKYKKGKDLTTDEIKKLIKGYRTQASNEAKEKLFGAGQDPEKADDDENN